jgi:hypothetical protein
MWFWIIIWISILIFNTVHSFLPPKYQAKKWIRIIAIVVATIILFRGVAEEIINYRGHVFAYVSNEGKIIKSSNFPWKITKEKTKESNIVYIINERFGDASKISVFPDNTNIKPKIRRGIDGIVIEFQCKEDQISNFKINIEK